VRRARRRLEKTQFAAVCKINNLFGRKPQAPVSCIHTTKCTRGAARNKRSLLCKSGERTMDLCLYIYKGCNFIAASGASYFVLGKQNGTRRPRRRPAEVFFFMLPIQCHAAHYAFLLCSTQNVLDTKDTQSVAAPPKIHMRAQANCFCFKHWLKLASSNRRSSFALKNPRIINSTSSVIKLKIRNW